jgi:superfamily I DNA and/or RNA helicase
MQPALMQFPFKAFSGGKIGSGVTPAQRQWLDFPNPNVSMVFSDVQNSFEQHFQDNSTYLNVIQMLELMQILTVLWNSEIPSDSIGGRTFYRGEVDSARIVIASLCPDEDWAFDIEVNTVDASPGGDIDFVIRVCVRANQKRDVSFLADEGRVNVVLTREKYGTFINGSCETLNPSQLCHIFRFIDQSRVQDTMIGCPWSSKGSNTKHC